MNTSIEQLGLLPGETPTPEQAAVQIELRPTFTPTPNWTATPTNTPTPTITPTPSATPIPPTETPIPEPTATPEPSETPTPEPSDTPQPTNTFPPPPPTDTPGPTDTPAPSYGFQLAELFNSPSNANIFSIIVAVQDANGNWIQGMRVVGVDPNGLVTKSEPSAPNETGYTPSDSSVVKTGNTKFEPQPVAVYISGIWTFHLETTDGQQATEKFSISVDEENRQWYFFRFAPK